MSKRPLQGHKDIDSPVRRPFKDPRRTSLKQERKEAHLKQVLKEVDQIQSELSQSDVGLFFGLPSKVPDLLVKNRGIQKLYEWQNECLNLPAVCSGKNLIYSLPTSGGKTLVAEVLIMKQILCKKKNCIFILPYVSIVQEKVRDFSPFAVELSFFLEEYAARKGVLPPIKRRKSHSVYIATIEKACGLVNSLIENNRLDEIGMVVVDELHMIGEGGARGAVLETTLAKIQHVSEKIQIIGMSATLGNIKDLQTFLSADVYCGDFRPVQLNEYIKIENELWAFRLTEEEKTKQFIKSRQLSFQYSDEMKKADPDHLMGLLQEIIPENSCLVFCPSKKSCENISKMICKMLNREIMQYKHEAKRALFDAMVNEGNGRTCEILRFTLAFGIAYHHAGLTIDERRLLEESYANGTLCCLVCTTTLAAGVNLPAKRVIIQSPYIATRFINRSRYKQMVGRAGRAGIDSSGESIMIIKPSEKQRITDMLLAPEESCQSSLSYNYGKGLRAMLLSLIALQIVKTKDEVIKFTRKTLYGIQSGDLDSVSDSVIKSIQDLKEKLLISEKSDVEGEEELKITTLGKATYKGAIDLDQAQMLYQDLLASSSSLNVRTSLHLLYLVTPYDYMSTISVGYSTYGEAFKSLSTEEQKIAEHFGINEVYVTRLCFGLKSTSIDWKVAHRFYISLILNDLYKKKSIWSVARKFDLHRGMLQNLVSGSAAFAFSVLRFCEEFEEFWQYQCILTILSKKLSECVTVELIPLMELPAVKQGRARLLFRAGYKTIADVANATVPDLIKMINFIPKKVAHQIISSAKMLLIEKAEALKEEAEDVLATIQQPKEDNI